MFKAFRIVVLLLILVLVAFYTKLQKLEARSWAEPLSILVYPVNADQSPVAQAYIERLQSSDFVAIDRFVAHNASDYNLVLPQPTQMQLAAILTESPPLPPTSGANLISVMWWSLRLRFWVQNHELVDDSRDAVRMFVLYHDPANKPSLPHSVGLAQGLIGIVHAYAHTDYASQNNVVIAHELLHTVGASDKYDPSSNEPVFPDGYADPTGDRYPQKRAEIMAGRIPISPGVARMPDGLNACVIGRKTAEEINWISVAE